MNERIRELEAECWEHDQSWTGVGQRVFNSKKFAELIVGECADYIRSNYDSWDAEPLAFNMEKDFGLHGDYAE